MTYDEAAARLRERTGMPLFADAPWDEALGDAIRGTEPEELFQRATIRDPSAAVGAVIGLRIWNDEFAAAHNLAQGLDDPTGSYWHAICHRREGHRDRGLEANLDNARHWFRRAGDHPAYETVYRDALNVLSEAGFGFRWATEAQSLLEQRGKWDPMMLVDWFGQVERGVLSQATRSLLEEIQWREIATLTDWCAEQALSQP